LETKILGAAPRLKTPFPKISHRSIAAANTQIDDLENIFKPTLIHADQCYNLFAKTKTMQKSEQNAIRHFLLFAVLKI